MIVKGDYHLNCSRHNAWRMLNDPDVLERCTPGCDQLTVVEPGVFDVTMKVGIAAISGTYKGVMELRNLEPARAYKIIVHGRGPIGTMEIQADIDLEEVPSGTDVTYEGEAKIGGVMAGLGQRALGPIAKFLVKQFFDKLSKEVLAATCDSTQGRFGLETEIL